MRFHDAVSASLFASLALAVPDVERRDWTSTSAGSVTAWPGPPTTCKPKTVTTTVTVWPGDEEAGAGASWPASSSTASSWKASGSTASGSYGAVGGSSGTGSGSYGAGAEGSGSAASGSYGTGSGSSSGGASGSYGAVGGSSGSVSGQHGAGGSGPILSQYGTWTWDPSEATPPAGGYQQAGGVGQDDQPWPTASASSGSYGSSSGSGYGSGSGSGSVSGYASGSAQASGTKSAGGHVGPSGSGAASSSKGKPSATSSRSPFPSHSGSPGNCHPCGGNTPLNRAQWCEYDLHTDYYETVPCTGVVREYWFNLVETIASPDGWPRMVQSINGSIPGPTIEADWGDEVVVHVTNSLAPESCNGTSLHFHGIQQKNTNSMDGANSITQCPTAPGDTYTYRWTATSYGSSWYHAHFGFQAWEGVFGAIVINGPASANYDVDLGHITLVDWNHWTADMLYAISQTAGPVTELTGLINGKNKWNTSISSVPTAPQGPPGGGPPPPSTKRQVPSNFTTTPLNTTTTPTNSSEMIGEYYAVNFQPGVSYRLRILNAAIDSGFKFSIDNHKLTVIANDFVPIEPYETDMISLTMGQRYDVIVKADQIASGTDFWMRAIPQKACSDNTNQLGIKGIVHYGVSTLEPTTTAYTYTDECVDEPSASLVPIVSKDVGTADFETSEAVTVTKNTNNYFEWTLNGTSFLVDWSNPALLDVYNNDTDKLKAQSNMIVLPTRGEWFYLLIQEAGPPVPHPIHLHGHDFHVLGSGTDTYNGTQTLQLSNPPRRDTAVLPGGGWLMLAWQADNPGTWLMHCHIGWHTLEGFALQFLELEDEILSTPGVIDGQQMTDTCDKWNAYAEQYKPLQGFGLSLQDSGL